MLVLAPRERADITMQRLCTAHCCLSVGHSPPVPRVTKVDIDNKPSAACEYSTDHGLAVCIEDSGLLQQVTRTHTCAGGNSAFCVNATVICSK